MRWKDLKKSPTFNNNNNGQQTADLDFKNGGYYNEAGALQGVVTGIETITETRSDSKPARIFTLDGREVKNPQRGIYIINGKKVVIN